MRQADSAGRTPGVAFTQHDDATVLFTDIEGSSVLLETLGDAAWLELLHEHNAIVRAEIGRYAGFEVKTVGDGFMVIFSDAAAAVRCAAGIQRGLARHAAEHPERALRVRMGLHSGEMIEDAADYYGRAVVIAARVMGAAGASEILVTEAVAAVVKQAASFGPPRSIVLKGLSDEVQVRAVVWENTPAEAAVVPLPVRRPRPAPRAPVVRGPELFERDEELAVLQRAVARLRERGEGGSVLISGPPGIGKSSLMDRALALAGELPVFTARGSELESALAFGAVRQLLTPLVRRIDAAERDALLSGPAQLAARVLGFADEGPVEDLSDPLYGLHWLCAELAERAPCVFAIDDLHWLDEESGRFVAYLAQRLEGVPLLLVATARPDGPGHAREPVEALETCGDVIRPSPLSVDAVARIVGGHDPAAAHHASGGNPFLAVEISRAPAGVSLDEVGPAAVGRAVLGRVARVSDAAVALAEAVSLFPAGATLEDVAVVAGLSAREAAHAADGLCRAAVLADDERLTFLHPVMRTAVYEQLGPFARKRGHGDAVRVLRERGAPIETVAAHLLLAAPEGEPENIRILRAAADAALAAAAPRGAIRYLERAIAEPIPEGELRAETLHLLGRLQSHVARPEGIETLRSALAAYADPGRQADAAADLAAVLSSHNRAAEGADLLEGFVERRELDPERQLTVDALLAGCALDCGRRARFEAAINRLPPDLPGDTPAQRMALQYIARRMAMAGAPCDEVLAVAVRAIDPDGSPMFAEFGALWGDVSTELTEFGELTLAEQLAEAQAAAARDSGRESEYLSATRLRGICAGMRGHLIAAEDLLREVLDHPASTPETAAHTSSMLVDLLAHRGRFDEAYAMADTIPEDATGWAPIIAMRRAQVDQLRGEFGTYQAFKDGVEAATDDGWDTVGAQAWLWCRYAEGLARCGGTEEAQRRLDELLPAADAWGDPQVLGQVHYALGQVGPPAAAVDRFSRAAECHAQGANELYLGYSRLELGAALRRAGRRVECREPLGLALDYAERHGAAVLADRAREELRMTGARPRRDFVTGSDALTPAEQRIARLAAAGHTNREIAGELFLTVGTVKTTLIKIYRKLGVSSREDLADALDHTP